jgi:hypothetical protein
VNGEEFLVKDLNLRAGLHHVVPVELTLREKNTISFSVRSEDPTFKAHLDGIEVLDGTEEEIEVKL